jgi:hypothetical protein
LLRIQSHSTTVPGGRRIAGEFEQFREKLPEILAARHLHVDEMSFGDFVAIVTAWTAEL